MNKRHLKVLTSAILLLVLMTVNISTVSAAEFGERTLRVGSRGEDVIQLQTHLKTLGAYTYSQITGYYGNITKSSVMAFQKYHGLSADGIAGPNTMGKIKSLLGVSSTTQSNTTSTTSFNRVLKTGDRGSDVIRLQDLLKSKGFFNQSVASTGYFGTITKTAVMNFQKSLGLSVDGIAGSLTYSALLGESQTVSRGTTPSRETSSTPSVTYKNHIVQSGDNFWNISMKYGVPLAELLKLNNATQSTVLSIGQTVKIPVYNVPVKSTPGSQYGEYLDWWTEAQYVIPNNAVFKVVDFYTGKSFMAKRTIGANHADVETLTTKDTEILKAIWGGQFTWLRRPVIVEYNGRRVAASASGMPHAGNDGVAGGTYASWRSDGYGAGTNLDYVKGNGMHGVFDIHFKNSTRHKDGRVDEEHQKNIKISAGITR